MFLDYILSYIIPNYLAICVISSLPPILIYMHTHLLLAASTICAKIIYKRLYHPSYPTHVTKYLIAVAPSNADTLNLYPPVPNTTHQNPQNNVQTKKTLDILFLLTKIFPELSNIVPNSFACSDGLRPCGWQTAASCLTSLMGSDLVS